MKYGQFTFLLAVITFVPSRCSAALHQTLSSELLAETFDYIVVGAGAAGAVIANRLSEDPSVSVLLIEAGSSDYNDTAIQIPALPFTLIHTRFDWNFTTTPQVGFGNRAVAYSRGHVLGGTTAINVMAWCRGTRDDYDRWARVTGDSGWSWDNLLPYTLKAGVDRMTPPVDNHDTTGQYDPDVHGQTGLLNVSLSGYLLETTLRSVAAAAEFPAQFPFNHDYNSGDTIGISYSQQTIYNGARFTSANGYIVPFLARPNLQVVVNTLVTRVLRTGSENNMPVFRGIEVQTASSDAPVTIQAGREVILSAGAVKSPHILMISGIGDSSYLESVGVKSLVDLPDVGQNLQDHVYLPLSWNVRPDAFTLDQERENATFAAAALAEWENSRTGPYALNTPGNTWGWFRLPANSSVFDIAPDPSAGPTSAHYEMVMNDVFISRVVAAPSTGNYFTISTNLIQPDSRGNITLASSDPLVDPIINPNFLTAPVDIAVLREAIKSARHFMSAQAWQDWVTGEFGAFANATTDAEIEAFARVSADTVNHVSGTVAMGKKDCAERGCGALNPDLTVKGTVGLRVVDASSFPYIISGHTQGGVYVLAERAADIIKGAA